MAPDYMDGGIARTLSMVGRRQPSRVNWTARSVESVREAHRWKLSKTPKGEIVTMQEMMSLLGIRQEEAYRLLRSGKIKVEQPYPGARWQIDRASLDRWSERKE